MSRRTKLVSVSIALGVLLVIAGIGMRRRLSPSGPTLVPAVAQRELQPYEFITSDMVAAGAPIGLAEARTRGIWSVDAAVGKMTTDLVQPGAVLSETNLQKIESMGRIYDQDLEIVSFYTTVDPRFHGRIRPGGLVDLYGFGLDSGGQPFMTLIAGRIWVVAVTPGSGRGGDVTPPDTQLANPTAVNPILPPEVITVAVASGKDTKIVEDLTVGGLIPWVTLAANQGMPIPTTNGPLAVPLVDTDGQPTRTPAP